MNVVTETTASVRSSQPAYEVRARRFGPGQSKVEIWQLPSPASPQLREPRRLGGLKGRNLELAENRIMKRLKAAGVRLDLMPLDGLSNPINEDAALRLALLFRMLAPMRNRDRMRMVAEGIEEMGREEAGYWLGMAVHRRNPRRVLMALRILLTDPELRI